MYGAYWCPHCAEQKEMFGTSFQYVPYVECGIKGSRDEAPVCAQAGVKHFPTWQFPDGERVLLRTAERLNVAPSVALLAGLEQLLGAENVRVA